MIKKVIKPFLDHSVYPISNKNWWGPFWVKTHPPSKFSGNLLNCFLCNPAETQPNKPIKQMEKGENTTSGDNNGGIRMHLA